MTVCRCLWLLLTGSMFLGVISIGRADPTPATVPSKPPVATPKAVDPGIKAMQDAVSTLSREYAAWKKDQKFGKLRETANFFQENPSTDITAKHILAELHQQTAPDPMADAYVKWQLMSRLTAKVELAQANDLFSIYAQVPQYPSHPGMDRKYWDQAIRGIKEDLSEKVNGAFQPKVDDFKTRIVPLIQYRNELFSHNPVSTRVMLAGLNDLRARVGAGINSTAFWTVYSSTVDVWTADDKTTHGDLLTLADDIKKLQAICADPKNQPYDHVTFDAKAKHLTWAPVGVLDGGQLGAVVTQLTKLANNPEPKMQIRKDN